MFDEIFLLILGGVLLLVFFWAFRTLPGEDWQILACLPGRKGSNGVWQGMNLTYYGFFNATACLLAVLIFLMMTGALNVGILAALSVVVPVLLVCMGAARLIARWVEKKHHTFSVGAASFIGIIIAPWIIFSLNITLGKWQGFYIPMVGTLTAMVTAYAFGEGLGRLACISFGCCYGQPLTDCHPIIRKVFMNWNFVFWGKTKKIVYAHQLEGQKVVPIQALTAVLYTGTGLLSLYFFLKGHAPAAFMMTLIITQGWRFLSEFLRADHRGQDRISAYQIMTLAATGYAFIMMPLLADAGSAMPNLSAGLISLWDPGLIIFSAVLWFAAFLYTGKSNVTCSSINIRIVEKNI